MSAYRTASYTAAATLLAGYYEPGVLDVDDVQELAGRLHERMISDDIAAEDAAEETGGDAPDFANFHGKP